MTPARWPARLGPLEVLRALAALALLALAPGAAWVDVLLPGLRTRLERFVFSVQLSVALLILATYAGNVALGVPVSGGAAVVYALVLAAAGIGVRLARTRARDAS